MLLDVSKGDKNISPGISLVTRFCQQTTPYSGRKKSRDKEISDFFRLKLSGLLNSVFLEMFL